MKKFVQKTCDEYLDRIVFIEHITGEEKRQLIGQAMAIVLPSIWENCSYVGLEAMSMEKTVIVSNTGGFIEMVDDRIDGYKFEVNDIHKMAELMYKVSMGEIVDTGAAAKKKILDKYNVEKIISQYEKLIYEVL